MPIYKYSVLKGDPISGKLSSNAIPHYLIDLNINGTTWEVAVNIESSDGSEVLYYLDPNFTPPDPAALEALAIGLTPLANVDANPAIDYLRSTITDNRFIAVLGSAADVEAIVRAHGHDHADYVLSGLPFSTLPDGVGPAIAAATHRALRPGGAFLVYQFSAKARDFMARHFRHIDQGFEPLNILPCRLFWGWKDEAGES